MIETPLADVEAWVHAFDAQEMPVLRHTRQQLAEAAARMHAVSGREITRIVLRDPLLAVRVLRYIQPLTGRRLHHDVATIAGSVMMLGVEPFFRHFEHLPTLEEQLKGVPQALLGALQVIQRAQQAAHYAYEWALWRKDVDVEEVALAALLHDLAEILLYVFAPKLALALREAQRADPGLRSVTAQENVLGLRLLAIQGALCRVWHVPELLRTLFDDEHADQPRVKNVALAVALARHLAHGEQDPALPDDLKAIAQLLNLSESALNERLGLGAAEPAAGNDTK
ncbi:MAG: HDOD domain-containing protein [Zoogloeaceae bacterium]|jgi:HD-like signal output (HDOD) protein|nr:HDOD domain-containing protein [Zoogloeaceae bacterium]